MSQVHARAPPPVRPLSLQLTSSSGHAKNGTVLPTSLASKTLDPKKANGNSTVNKRHSVGSRNAPIPANPLNPVSSANSKGAETKSNEPPAPVQRHPAQSHSNGNDPTIASRRNSKNPPLRTPTSTSGPGSGIGSGTGPGSGYSSGPTPLSGGNIGNGSKTGVKNGNGTESGSCSKNGSVASKAEVASASSAVDTTPKQSCCAIA
jgi:hypothetical protein